MVTSLLFVEKHFDGVLLTVKPLKKRLSKKEKGKSFIAAKVVEAWLNDPTSKLIILSLLSQLGRFGMAIGMNTAGGVSLKRKVYKYFVRTAIEQKQPGKTS